MLISELPEKYKYLAKQNQVNPDCNISNTSNVLATAFKWSKTPEGDKFWEACYHAKSISDLPNINDKWEIEVL